VIASSMTIGAFRNHQNETLFHDQGVPRHPANVSVARRKPPALVGAKRMQDLGVRPAIGLKRECGPREGNTYRHEPSMTALSALAEPRCA